MLVSSDPNYLHRARHISTTAKKDPLRYFHDEIGYNYRLVNVLAALGVAQLEQLESFLESKIRIADFYRTELNGIGDIAFQKIGENVSSNEWLFTILTERMEELLNHLNNSGVMSRPFWVPMNRLPMYSNCEYINIGDVSNQVHRKALSIPCSTNISSIELETVVNTIREFFD